ncbi:hypothetical protein GGH95_005184, partial [Coemansia sp. RSA 1836]
MADNDNIQYHTSEGAAPYQSKDDVMFAINDNIRLAGTAGFTHNAIYDDDSSDDIMR